MIKHSKFSMLLREPLFHFLLIGAIFFFIFSQMNTGEDENEQQIIITKAKIKTLENDFRKVKGRLPTSKEMEKQLEYNIREEVLYREAMAMDLDKDDMIIRRRLTQKMKYLFDDLSVVIKPSEEELKKFIAEHPSKFMLSATISFAQVYFDPKKHETTLYKDANILLKKLRITTIKESIDLGDRSLLPYDFKNERKVDIDNKFGKKFSEYVFSSPTNIWEGPFESAYGVHLIYIHEHIENHVPPLSDIRDNVEREWTSMKEDEANELFYKSLYQRYEIIVNDEVVSNENLSAK